MLCIWVCAWRALFWAHRLGRSRWSRAPDLPLLWWCQSQPWHCCGSFTLSPAAPQWKSYSSQMRSSTFKNCKATNVKWMNEWINYMAKCKNLLFFLNIFVLFYQNIGLFAFEVVNPCLTLFILAKCSYLHM